MAPRRPVTSDERGTSTVCGRGGEGDNVGVRTGSDDATASSTWPASATHRRVLVVNTRNVVASATVPGGAGGTVAVVDEATGDGPPRCTAMASDTLTLQPFATAVVTLPDGAQS